MKKILLLLPLFVHCLIAKSQTLHGIIVADTKDRSIGVSCQQDLVTMSERLGYISKKINYRYNEVICDNEKFGKTGIQKIINELNCSPQDVVFFYYTGHGLNTLNRTSSFPLLHLNNDNDTELEAIHLQLKAKSPRFCMTLGDCCNNIFADTRTMRPILPIFKGIFTDSDQPNILAKLFAETEGDLILTSAKRGEKAAAYPSRGSFYTNSWMEALGYAESNNRNITWETLLSDAENRLQQSLAAQNIPDSVRHHSHWVVGYKKNVVNNTSTVSFDEINKFLSKLADESIPFQERNTLRIKDQTRYFSKTAVVDIYINSPDHPVQQQNIDQFLKRIIATARLIHQFNFVEMKSKLDATGQYSLITLQEVR